MSENETLIRMSENDYIEFERIIQSFESNAKKRINKLYYNVREEVEQEVIIEEEEDEPIKMSNRQRKKNVRLTSAQLKILSKRPDLVEFHDTSSSESKLLVYLKGYRNTVQVPRSWKDKKNHLAPRAGSYKQPYVLPDYLRYTNIQEFREMAKNSNYVRRLRNNLKEISASRLGRMDVDYEVLRDAFLKYQTKPRMTKLGDLYYEDKEKEVYRVTARPGKLSEQLREALNISDNGPPPWLLKMQMHGFPPSYPNLLIPGMNAPIPENQSWGYHPGGWGRAPLDRNGLPVRGDPYEQFSQRKEPYAPVEITHWGEIGNIMESFYEQIQKTHEPQSLEESYSNEEYQELECSQQLQLEPVKELEFKEQDDMEVDIVNNDTVETSIDNDQSYFQVLIEKNLEVKNTDLLSSDKIYKFPEDDNNLSIRKTIKKKDDTKKTKFLSKFRF